MKNQSDIWFGVSFGLLFGMAAWEFATGVWLWGVLAACGILAKFFVQRDNYGRMMYDAPHAIGVIQVVFLIFFLTFFPIGQKTIDYLNWGLTFGQGVINIILIIFPRE